MLSEAAQRALLNEHPAAVLGKFCALVIGACGLTMDEAVRFGEALRAKFPGEMAMDESAMRQVLVVHCEMLLNILKNTEKKLAEKK